MDHPVGWDVNDNEMAMLASNEMAVSASRELAVLVNKKALKDQFPATQMVMVNIPSLKFVGEGPKMTEMNKFVGEGPKMTEMNFSKDDICSN